jgi:hypothetical protein
MSTVKGLLTVVIHGRLEWQEENEKKWRRNWDVWHQALLFQPHTKDLTLLLSAVLVRKPEIKRDRVSHDRHIPFKSLRVAQVVEFEALSP